MERDPLKIVVIGAGYAGMLTTVRLAGKVKRQIRSGDVAITLVNAADAFMERVRLHQFVANQPLPHRPITRILRGTGVAFLCGMATGIDVARRTVQVQTDTGVQLIPYDNLVYALGS